MLIGFVFLAGVLVYLTASTIEAGKIAKVEMLHRLAREHYEQQRAEEELRQKTPRRRASDYELGDLWGDGVFPTLDKPAV